MKSDISISKEVLFLCTTVDILHINHCACGAYTVVLANGEEASMYKGTLEGIVGEIDEEKFLLSEKVNLHTFNCNHCVNKWGIDLCSCGCGEPIGSH